MIAPTSLRQDSESADALTGRAEQLLPVLAERALAAERLGRLPPQTIEDLASAGLLRIATPARFGGTGHDIDVCFEVAMQLARACGSTAWCYSVWSSHNWMIGQWPLEAQEEYFDKGPDVLCSSSFAPGGKLLPDGDGFRLSGRWGFSSGSDPGRWAMLSALGSAGPVFALVPRSDYRIEQTWTVSGLKGTGSNDIVLEDVHVPGHRIGPFAGGGEGSVGWQVHHRASYRVPTFSILSWTLCAPLIGMAQGALDQFVAEQRVRRAGPGAPGPLAGQLRVAEAAALIDAARRTLRVHAADVLGRGERGDPVSHDDLAVLRRDYSFVGRLTSQAVNLLFDASSAHALFDDDPMQRFHRDIHAGTHHVMLRWDAVAEDYGRLLLGA